MEQRSGVPSKRRVVGYVRVSSEEQATSGHSIEAQRAKLQAYCDLHDVELVEVVSDAGLSAATTDRAGLQRILGMIDRREVDTVLVAKLDRLTRSVRDLGDLLDRMRRRGVDLASVAESLDTSSACGRLIVNMLGVLAQWEREQTGERTAAVLHDLRRRGRRYSLHAPIGKRIAGDELFDNEGEVAAVTALRSIAGSGLSLRSMSAVLARQGHLSRAGKPFTASAVQRLLRRGAV